MHNGAKYTPEALEAVILGLKEKGYTIVPISELIYTENYEMDHEGRQHLKDSTTPSGTTGTTAGGNATVTPSGTPSAAPTVTPVSQITAAQNRGLREFAAELAALPRKSDRKTL